MSDFQSGDEVIREFLVESNEGLDQMDREFVALEENPTQQERLQSVFRIIHTIKGTSGFLGFSRLESLTHTGENLLSLLRDGKIILTPAITSALLLMVDRVRQMLVSIESGGSEGEASHDDVKKILADLATTDTALSSELTSVSAESASDMSAGQGPASTAANTPDHEKPKSKKLMAPPVKRSFAHRRPKVSEAKTDDLPVWSVDDGNKHSPDVSVEAGADIKDSKSEPVIASKPSAPTESLEKPTLSLAPAPTVPSPVTPAAEPVGAISDASVRVDIGLLDKLMNLVGELVLARNQMMQMGARSKDQDFLGAAQRLDLVTTDLQENVMKTRMQPIGNVWAKLPRIVRDLAVSCGKQIRVEMFGKETELDRTILEAIKDPLTHIVRNAADHGLEPPEERAFKGKPKTGTLTLKAYHEGGQVNIEIADDGRGLNIEAIKKKAVDKKLITAERAHSLNEYEAAQLIFLPGLSTAEQVTNVSGRGVGMDVVKTNIEKIGGTVDLMSRVGVGTTLKIRIPLTLAIVPALVVISAGQRYAIPQTNLLELVKLESGGDSGIETMHGTPVYRLRGELLPLLYLNSALELTLPDGSVADFQNIVVLQANEQTFGLLVEEVGDTEEIVVKPLGRELKQINVFAGATIMGDGTVSLILDVVGLAEQGGAMSRKHEKDRSEKKRENTEEFGEVIQKQSLLIFSIGERGKMAVPLELVARLEEVNASRIEIVGQECVVQYRGEILPLINLAPTPQDPDARVPVLVYSANNHTVGFLVERIIDVVSDYVNLERFTAQPGVKGTAIINGEVMNMLDIDGIVHARAPWFYEDDAA